MCLRSILGGGEDVVRWELEKSGKFSIKSMYNFITNPGVRDVRMLDM